MWEQNILKIYCVKGVLVLLIALQYLRVQVSISKSYFLRTVVIFTKIHKIELFE